MVDVELEKVATDIVDAAIKVHRALGPGLLESAYQQCLALELSKRGRLVQCEVMLPIIYDGQSIDHGFRADMMIDRCILIENKAVDQVLPLHIAQLLTYLKLSDLRLGFLLNWNVELMKKGIRRVANNYTDQPQQYTSPFLLSQKPSKPSSVP